MSIFSRWWGRREPQLPQFDPQPAARARSLRATRAKYRYAPPEPAKNPMSPVAVAAAFPFWTELWTAAWFARILPRVIRVYARVSFKKARFTVRTILGVGDLLAAYRDLDSSVFGAPPGEQQKTYREDEYFAQERLDGPNPTLVRRVDPASPPAAPIPHLGPLRDEEFEKAAGEKLADVRAAGRLFYIDYQVVRDAQNAPGAPFADLQRDSRSRAKYLPAPVAVFVARAAAGGPTRLHAVAIRVDGSDARDSNKWTPIVYAGDPDWDLAKLYLRVADANVQEEVTHNFRHHYIAEAFTLASRRQLPRIHPVHTLLEPHLAFTLTVNGKVTETLLAHGSDDDLTFAGSLALDRRLIKAAQLAHRWDAMGLCADLRDRGVEAEPAEYPWRDDAKRWMSAIDTYVGNYLAAYYETDALVATDWELRAWADELSDPAGGNINALGPITTVGRLREVLAQFIFIAGPSHASVHFPITSYLSWVPGYPRAAYRPPFGADSAADPKQLELAALPPFFHGVAQYKIGQLAGHQSDRFGDFRRYRIGRLGGKVGEAVKALNDDLAQITRDIQTANAGHQRRRAYEFLLPGNVTNSVSL